MLSNLYYRWLNARHRRLKRKERMARDMPKFERMQGQDD